MTPTRTRSLILLAALLVCALPADAAPPGSRARVRRGWDYSVVLSPDLKRATVQICFRRFLPRGLVLSSSAAYDALGLAAAPDQPSLTRASTGGPVVPVGLTGSGCVQYDVDLTKLTEVRNRRSDTRIGQDLLFDPGLLLLRPQVWPKSVYVTCRFHCPKPLNVSVSWPAVTGSEAPHHYELLSSALTRDTLIAVGRFPPQTLVVAGASFRIARLDRPHKATADDIEAWIGAAARAVAPLFGQFPAREAQILVLPVGASRRPVVFGRARKAGGASVTFYLSALADKQSLVGEWVGVHEMIHLGMPWTVGGEAWFQEGFTTYYQEVLRTRAGFQDARAGWQELLDGFRRGSGGKNDRTLHATSREMHQTHAYWRVYWGGAAVAFLLDVEIRRRTRGRRGLDDVIRHLFQRHARSGRAYTGLELLAAADRYLGQAICVPLATPLLAGKGFPDLSHAEAALGLVVDAQGTVRLDPEAPDAGIARAIMAPPAAAESGR